MSETQPTDQLPDVDAAADADAAQEATGGGGGRMVLLLVLGVVLVAAVAGAVTVLLLTGADEVEPPPVTVDDQPEPAEPAPGEPDPTDPTDPTTDPDEAVEEDEKALLAELDDGLDDLPDPATLRSPFGLPPGALPPVEAPTVDPTDPADPTPTPTQPTVTSVNDEVVPMMVVVQYQGTTYTLEEGDTFNGHVVDAIDPPCADIIGPDGERFRLCEDDAEEK